MSNIRTIRGQLTVPDILRIELFDGLFTTGYRLLSFKIQPSDPTSSFEVAARLCLEDLGHTTEYNWGSNLEIGWATYNTPIATRFGEFSLVDSDSVIIEDLFIDPQGTLDVVVNYLIELERVTFSEAMGAFNMVRNRSQG